MVEVSKIRHRAPRSVPVRSNFLVSASVEDLFGRITYKNISLNHPKSSKNINIIYGDNGSGKTTIFNLIYACLSPETGIGLRTYIAKTPFSKFSIEFADKTSIRVIKTNGLTGSYDFLIRQKDTKKFLVHIRADEDGDVTDQPSASQLEMELSKLGIDVLFVDHQRIIKSTYRFIEEASTEDFFYSDYARTLEYTRNHRRSRRENLFPILGMIDAVNNRFRSEAFQQGNLGEIDASHVYLEIARALNRPAKRGDIDETRAPLDQVLDHLSSLAESYVRHGLLPAYPFAEIKLAFTGAARAKKITISDALQPFITSIERRIKALSELNDLMKTFEEELNLYLTDKRATIHVLNGLTIFGNGKPIPIESMSSGEKQLIFLLCAAVVAQANQSLILIDEPELSLNYKWQRNIATSLELLSSKKTTQFILASHSIEIISKFRTSSQELKNERTQKDA